MPNIQVPFNEGRARDGHAPRHRKAFSLFMLLAATNAVNLLFNSSRDPSVCGLKCSVGVGVLALTLLVLSNPRRYILFFYKWLWYFEYECSV